MTTILNLIFNLLFQLLLMQNVALYFQQASILQFRDPDLWLINLDLSLQFLSKLLVSIPSLLHGFMLDDRTLILLK